jgi:hypothetical protein
MNTRAFVMLETAVLYPQGKAAPGALAKLATLGYSEAQTGIWSPLFVAFS